MLQPQSPICANLIIYRWYQILGGVNWEEETHCAVDFLCLDFDNISNRSHEVREIHWWG